ncbi:lipopolysaccharide biosynthesis protein [Kutzneria chonburiensis]|uniref:Lipopolysaccharide biosynthesis protein n=2 Tax=Kutzneria chonburiensis TaxID=1483604 RepID=A0ABV6N8C8_9PSEU
MTATVSDGRMVRDGIALSVGAAFTSVAGLVGWVISARLVPTAEVGLTAAFTSGFLLVSGVTQVSLGPAVLRWLPRAGGRSGTLLLRTYGVVMAGAVLGALVFLAFPAGRQAASAVPGWGAPLFVIVTLAWAVLQFQDPVLTGLDRAGTVLVKNLGFGVGRIAVLVLAASLGALGILLSWAIPTILAVLGATVVVVMASNQRDRKTSGGVLPNRPEVVGLLGPTYLASIGQSLMYYLVPLIVTARYGPAPGAVFFVVWTAVNAVDVAATGFVNSLVVRIAGEPERAGDLVRLAGKRLAMLFGPMIVAGVLLARPLLSIFGPDYAELGSTALMVVLIGFAPRLLILVVIGVFQADGSGVPVAAFQLAGAAVMLPVALLLPTDSLVPLALGFLAVQGVVAAVAAVSLRRRLEIVA